MKVGNSCCEYSLGIWQKHAWSDPKVQE